jgi:hypothetical protein
MIREDYFWMWTKVECRAACSTSVANPTKTAKKERRLTLES